MESEMEAQREARKRPDLKEWRGGQWQRSEKNATDLCVWLHRWGWTTGQIVCRVLGLARPGVADEMVKRGFLEKVEAQPGWRESFVFILRPAGISLAEAEMDNKLAGYVTPNPYTLHESRRIPWSIHGHNMTAQHVLLDLLGQRPEPLTYFTEPELRRDHKDRDAVPDFMVIRPDKRWACEIELNHKEDLRLRRWLFLRAQDMQRDEDLSLQIFTPLNSVANAIRQILASKSLHEVRRSQTSGKLITRKDVLPIDLSTLKDRISINMLSPNRQRRSGGWQWVEEE